MPADQNVPAVEPRTSSELPSGRWFRWLLVVQGAVIVCAVVLLVFDLGDLPGMRAFLPVVALLLLPVIVFGGLLLLRHQQRRRPWIDRASDAREENDATAKIQAVLAGNTLVTAFQPIRLLSSGAVVGAEALTRFPGPSDTTPEAWFVEAESVGLGVDLEFRAMETALTAAQGLPVSLYIAVNISPLACLDPRLMTVLKGSGLSWDRIVLEVTERHEVVDYDPLAAALRPLREAGARIAVDDAGAGFASMRHILQLAPDMVKLDRYVTSGIDTDPGQRALAAAMAGFARETGAMLIAEGIETPAELETLASLGIETGQGYLLGRPSIEPEDWSHWSGE